MHSVACSMYTLLACYHFDNIFTLLLLLRVDLRIGSTGASRDLALSSSAASKLWKHVLCAGHNSNFCMQVIHADFAKQTSLLIFHVSNEYGSTPRKCTGVAYILSH